MSKIEPVASFDNHGNVNWKRYPENFIDGGYLFTADQLQQAVAEATEELSGIDPVIRKAMADSQLSMWQSYCEKKMEVESLRQQLAPKDAEIAELRKDAERYRWMLDRIGRTIPIVRIQIMRRGQYVLIDRELDAAIDKARSGE